MSTEKPDDEHLAAELDMLDAVDPMPASLPDPVRERLNRHDPDQTRR